LSIRGNDLQFINHAAAQDPAALVAASENRFAGIITQIVNTSLKTGGHSLLMLAGPSASGKTTTAQKIADELALHGVATYRLSLDDFYLPAAEIPNLPSGAPDYECLRALDLPLLHTVLADLLHGGTAVLPAFNFKTGKREEGRRVTLQKQDVLIAEGLHALNPALTARFIEHPENVNRIRKLYISVSSRIYDTKQGANVIMTKRALRLTRRILRDAQFRNAPAAETISMWPAVLAGEDQYLTPCKPYADMCINATHLYAPCVLRTRTMPLLEAIVPTDPGYDTARKLLRGLRRFTPIAETCVPETSLLREFLGNAPIAMR
jgi:uridine kinase